MKFRNTTKNSVYLEDINLHIPYESDETVYDILLDDVKKSFSFQNMIVLGAFEIHEHDGSRIEKNLIKLREKMINKQNSTPKENQEEIDSGSIPEVVIKGQFYEAGGYAKVNRNLAIGLAKHKIKVEINPISTRNNDLNEIEVSVLASLKKRVGKKAIKIDSIIPTFTEVSSGSFYRILYTTIEACTVPKQIVDICNRYNEIWVTSDFCKEVLEKENIKVPIFVMPPGVQTKIYNENQVAHEFYPSLKKFVFCSVFGWSYRKGWDALLKSYLQEFSADDDVSLLLVSRYQYSSDRSDIIKKDVDSYIEKFGKKSIPHIARCSRVIPEYELPKIYRACDAFVLPSRGEGLGLPYCEASLCGLPIIATNHSGHTMFLNKDNSSLVDIDNLEKITRGTMHVHYWDNQVFPSLKSQQFIDNLSKSMRYVFNNYKECVDKNKILQKYIIDNYSFDASAIRIKNRLLEIWSKS